MLRRASAAVDRLLTSAIEAVTPRADSWSNPITGAGLYGTDRQMSTQFVLRPAFPAEVGAALFHGDPIARRVAEAFSETALMIPPVITGPNAEQVTRDLERLSFISEVQLADGLGRATGGALIVLGTDDDAPATAAPVNARGVRWLEVYDRRQIAPSAYDTDARSHLAGRASVFTLTPTDGRPQFQVHRSRCIMFGGIPTAPRERDENMGWDRSIYDLIYDAIRSLNDGYLSLGHMLGDASQSVFKLRGLLSALADPNGRARMAERGRLLDLFRGLTRSTLLDADSGESYERHPMQFNGVPDTVDRLFNFVAAVSTIPVTVLAGTSPAGMNATGASDFQGWYNRVEVHRTRRIAPAYRQALAGFGPGLSVEFPSLWTPTAKEQAEIEKIQADRDAVYLDREVCSPEDIARARLVREPGPVIVDLAARVPALELPGAVPPVAPPAEPPVDPLQTVDEVRVTRGLAPVNDSRLVADVGARVMRIRAVKGNTK